MANVACSRQLERYILGLKGVSHQDFSVKVVVPHRLTQVTHFLFGQIATLAIWLVGSKNLPSIAHFSVEARSGFLLQVTKKDKEKERMDRILRCLPYSGLALGILTGLAVKSGISFPCLSDQAVLMVNRMKQWEIKYAAYLTPFIIPFAIKVISLLNEKRTDVIDVIIHKLKEKIKKHIRIKMHTEFSLRFVARITSACASTALSFSHILGRSIIACKDVLSTREAYLSMLALLGLGNSLYTGATHTLFQGFDISGHCMLKTVSAALLSSELTSLNDKTPQAAKKKWVAYALFYALTDAVLIHQTVARHHTVSESLSGLILGVALVAFSALATQKAALKAPVLY